LTNLQGNSFPPAGTLYEMNKALVIGNGESRAWFRPHGYYSRIFDEEVVTWGCNAIYRDGAVHNLVAIDYGMQQEIYDSGYCLDNPEYGDTKVIHFANWSPVPADVADMMFMGYDIPEAFIHRSKNRTDQCVISGKDPVTLQEKIETAIKMNPNLDMNDLKLKMEKDVGVWITYVEPKDDVVPINYPVGWSAGNTALYLACQHGAEKVYVLGFDLSSYDQPLNNMYKGTNNYLPVDAKGFNPVNWYNQMRAVFREFSLYDTKFYLVDSTAKFDEDNVSFITKNELCEELKIV
jgi:hypothetical protein